MRVVLFFILFLLIGIFQLSAQNFQWVKVDSGYTNILPSFGVQSSISCDENNLIYRFTRLMNFNYYDSTTSSASNVNYGSIFTIHNTNSKLIRRTPIPGVVQSMVLDKNGNTYLTGFFSNKYDFDPGKSSSVLNSDGSEDVFILKYNSSGKLIFALRVGGTSNDKGTEIEFDNNYNITIMGTSSGLVDFDPGASTYKINSTGSFNLLLDSSGKFISVKTNQPFPYTSQKDSIGNIYSLGNFNSKFDLDPDSIKTFYLTPVSNSIDGFIRKLAPNGKLIWAISLGGKLNDYINSLVIDKWQNVYAFGTFQDSIDLDPGSKKYYLGSRGKNDAFICKLDSMGNFIWGLRLGSTDDDNINFAAIDDSTNLYSCGSFSDTVDFDPGSKENKLFSNASADLFILKLNLHGKFVWAKKISGKSGEYLSAITIDKKYNAYLSGYFNGTVDFNPDTAKYELTSGFTNNAFLLKLGPCPSPTESTITGPSVLCGKDKIGTYSVTQSSGAKGYIWRVPKGAKIDSGQGSNKIYVTFDTILGEISVRPTNICDTSV